MKVLDFKQVGGVGRKPFPRCSESRLPKAFCIETVFDAKIVTNFSRWMSGCMCETYCKFHFKMLLQSEAITKDFETLVLQLIIRENNSGLAGGCDSIFWKGRSTKLANHSRWQSRSAWKWRRSWEIDQRVKGPIQINRVWTQRLKKFVRILALSQKESSHSK